MQKKTDLNNLTRMVLSPKVKVQIDEQFIGRLGRDDGWAVKHWQLPWQVLFLIHEGSCSVSTRDRLVTAAAGQAVLLDPARTVSVAFSRVIRYSEVRFRLTEARGCWTLRQPVILLHQAYPLAGHIDHLAREVRMQSGKVAEVTNHWLALILAYADRYAQQFEEEDGSLTTAQLDALIQHVHKHLGQPIQPSELAEVVQLSADYFTRLFKRTIGESPRTWLVRERIRHACHLLQYSVDNVDQIALQVGYVSSTHFCRQFRQMMGSTPAAWRQKVR